MKNTQHIQQTQQFGRVVQPWRARLGVRAGYGQSLYEDSGFQMVWLKQNLDVKGCNSQAHREPPGNSESIDLSRENLSRE